MMAVAFSPSVRRDLNGKQMIWMAALSVYALGVVTFRVAGRAALEAVFWPVSVTAVAVLGVIASHAPRARALDPKDHYLTDAS
jgi:hypothetical protein